MKCINIKAGKGSIQFDCPHCGVDAEIDDDTIGELWTHFSGQVTCPPPQGCNMQFEIPAIEEVKKLRAGADSEPVVEQETGVNGEGVAPTEPTEDSKLADTKELEEEDSSFVEGEFEKYVASKEGEKTEVTSPLSIRTFRRMECIVQGQNKFDETVSIFLGEIGRNNVISVTPFTYQEKGEDWTDYGVIVYYAQPAANETQSREKKSEPVVWRA